MSRYYLRATILTASLLGLAVVLPVNATAAAAAAPASIAAPAGRPTINLSLNEAVAIALQKNFDVKTQDLTLANNKETYNSAKLEYKPTMSVGTSFNGSQSGATGSSIAASDHVDSQAVTGSVSQKIPTGAVVSLTSTFLSRSNTANSPTTPSFGRLLTLSVSQPLLRGARAKRPFVGILRQPQHAVKARLLARNRVTAWGDLLQAGQQQVTPLLVGKARLAQMAPAS